MNGTSKSVTAITALHSKTTCNILVVTPKPEMKEFAEDGSGQRLYLLVFLSFWTWDGICRHWGLIVWGRRGQVGWGVTHKVLLSRGAGIKRVCSYLIFLGNCRLLAKDQENQVLLFTAELCGNLVERQVIPQVFHLHLDQLLPLESCGSEPLAQVAEQGPTLGLVWAGSAKVLLTVQADVLGKRGEGRNQSQPVPCAHSGRRQRFPPGHGHKAQSKPSKSWKSAKCLLPMFLEEEKDWSLSNQQVSQFSEKPRPTAFTQNEMWYPDKIPSHDRNFLHLLRQFRPEEIWRLRQQTCEWIPATCAHCSLH